MKLIMSLVSPIFLLPFNVFSADVLADTFFASGFPFILQPPVLGLTSHHIPLVKWRRLFALKRKSHNETALNNGGQLNWRPPTFP